jgi:hypothetical protein
VRFVAEMLGRLGFLINEAKSKMEPTQKVLYLGIVWDLVNWRAALKPAREDNIRADAARLRSAEFVTCRQVASLLGKVQSAAGAVPLARARIRTTQWDFLASCRSKRQYNDFMTLSDDSKEELLFWEHLESGLSSPISLPMSFQSLDTDASDEGIGIYFKGDLIAEPVPEGHICQTELWALGRALTMLEGRIEQGVLTWRVDNNAALAAIRNQGSTRSWGLSWMAVQILKDAERQGVIIDPVRVSSEENNLADAASRFKEVPDWSLKPDIVNKMFIRWGKADVDLMATTESRKAPFFYGWRSCDTEALALDSLARDVDWSGWENPYCFPPFSLVGAVLQKCCEQRLKRMILVVPWWPSKAFFGNLQVIFLSVQACCNHPCPGDAAGLPEDPGHQGPGAGPDVRRGAAGPQEVPLGRLHSFWQAGQGAGAGVSEDARQLIEASWRGSTEEQYGSCWRRWTRHCGAAGVPEHSPTLAQVLDFLATLYSEGKQYRTVNTYRSVLSSTLLPMDGFKIGCHPLVCRLMKGIFNKRPPVKSLVATWSVTKVLQLLRTWSPAKKLDLKCLTLKTVMLLALASARRVSSLVLLSLNNGYCEISESKVKFQPAGLEKQSRVGHIAPPLEIDSYRSEDIDPVTYVKEYILRTKSLRKAANLFVTIQKPHAAAKKSTIASWISKVISMSGQAGSGGSVRSVASSQAVSRGVTLEKVLEAGDWARESTFRRFYFKPAPLSFVEGVMS